MKILVLEEDKLLARGIASKLRRHVDCRTNIVHDCDAALERCRSAPPDVALLGCSMRSTTATDALHLCRELRRSSPRAGILVLAVRDAVEDRVAAFEAGADDCLVKPCEPEELVARVTALARRVSTMPGPPTPVVAAGQDEAASDGVLQWGDISVDLYDQTVRVMGLPCDVPRLPFKVLVFLLRNAGTPKRSAEIRQNVLRTAADPDSSSIRNIIRDLRSRLGLAGKEIQLIRGKGYGVGLHQ